MKKINVLSFSLLGALAAGACASSTDASQQGNDKLGIAEYQVTETPGKTVIVGVDQDQNEVATVEIDVGQYVGTELGDNLGTTVDGRRLEIDAKGVRHFYWEIEGYNQTAMPAGPDSLVSDLVFDPFVSSYLAKQNIGFRVSQPGQAQASNSELPYSWVPAALSYNGDVGYTLNCCDNRWSYNGTPNGSNCNGDAGGVCVMQILYPKSTPKTCNSAPAGTAIASGYGTWGQYNGTWQAELVQVCKYYGTPGTLTNYLTMKDCDLNGGHNNDCGGVNLCDSCGIFFQGSASSTVSAGQSGGNWYIGYTL